MPSDVDIIKELKNQILLEGPFADYTKLKNEELLAKVEMLKRSKNAFHSLPLEQQSSDLEKLLSGIGGKIIEVYLMIEDDMITVPYKRLVDLPGAAEVYIGLRFSANPNPKLSSRAKGFIDAYYNKHIKSKKISELFVEYKNNYSSEIEKLEGDKLKEASEKLGMQPEDIDNLERWSEIELPAILKPKNMAVQKICNKYRAKYGIDIYGVLTSFGNGTIRRYDPTALLEKAESDGETVFGAIIGQPEGKMMDEAHVTPVLFFKIGAKWQYVILGSLGSAENLMPMEEVKGAKNYRNITIRQADKASCRTDALLILRNALLHIKYMKKHVAEKGGIFILDEFLKGYLSDKKCKTEKEVYINVPLEWGFSSQLLSELVTTPKFKDILNYRKYFSSTPEKRRSPETIAEHRDRYTVKMNMTESYVGQKKDKEAIKQQELKGKDYNMELQQKAEKYYREVQELEWMEGQKKVEDLHDSLVVSAPEKC